MNKDIQLTEEQIRHISETLKRIRDGLAKFPVNPVEEPAHIFIPEAFNEEL